MAAQVVVVIRDEFGIQKVKVRFKPDGKAYAYTNKNCTQYELESMVRIHERGLGGLTRFMNHMKVTRRNS